MMGDYDFYSNEDGIFQFDQDLETAYGCDSIMHYTITVGNGGTGVSEANLPYVTLYPNPATDECHLIGLGTGIRTDIRIFNVFGQIVKELSTDNEKVTLDLQGMKAGVYTIQLVQGQETRTMKFIKL